MPASAMMRKPAAGAAGAAIVIAIVGAAAILGAFFFQYGLGLEPCPLCLERRGRRAAGGSPPNPRSDANP